MIWVIIISAELLTLLVLPVWQTLQFIRMYYFDQSLFALRELRHETVIYLSDHVMNEQFDRNEFIELRKMLQVLEFSINRFEMLDTKSFNYKSFKRIFQSIDSSIEKAENEVKTQSAQAMALKIKFSKALLMAFSTKFVFRYRFAFFILKAISRFLASISKRYTVSSIEKLKYIISTYQQLERNSYEFD